MTTRRAHFRFVNSHLEAFGIPGVDAEAVRVAQVDELLAAQAAVAAQSGALPMVYVGDYNSDAPDGAAYTRLLAGVGQDAWTRSHPRDAGSVLLRPDADRPDRAADHADRPRAGQPGVKAATSSPSPATGPRPGCGPPTSAPVVARLVLRPPGTGPSGSGQSVTVLPGLR